MVLLDPGHQVPHDDVRATQPASVGADEDTPSLEVWSDRDELVQNPVPPKQSEGSHKLPVVPDHAEDVAVEEDSEDPLVADLLPREEPHVLHAAVVGQADDRALGEFGGDVSHQGQVLHQAAALPLGSVTRNSSELVLVVITVTEQ